MISSAPNENPLPSSSLNLAEQVHGVESRIHALAVERADLLSQLEKLDLNHVNLYSELNSLRASTRMLPAEVLSRIFVFYASPIHAGAVCSYWRKVAWGTPLLWSTITSRMSKNDRRGLTKNCVYKLRLFLENSRSLKVSIELCLDGWDMSRDDDTIRELLVILAEEVNNRVRVLRLKSSEVWHCRVVAAVYFHLYTTTFPNLEILETDSDLHHSRYKINAPRVRHLVLKEAPMADWSLNQKFWNQLTTLQLHKTILSVCFKLLRSSPQNLQSFECVNPYLGRRSTLRGLDLTSPINIPTGLTRFKWTGSLGRFQEYFWTNVHLPAVRYLKWNLSSPFFPEDMVKRHNFFRRLSKLEVLAIQDYHGIHELRDVLSCFESLRELRLDACKLQKAGVDVIKFLTLSHDAGHQNLLPILKKLSVDILIGDGESIVRMLHSRRHGPLLSGHAERATNQLTFGRLEKVVLQMEQFCCQPAERGILGDLVAGGLQLDI